MTETEKNTIDGLIRRDEKITNGFYFTLCKPMLTSVARGVFMDSRDYEGLLNELLEYLIADNGAMLRQFKGKRNKSTFYKWLGEVANKYFIRKKKETVKTAPAKCQADIPNNKQKEIKKMDVAALIELVDLERDRLVLKKIDVEGVKYDDLSKLTGLSKANLYNIRKRALERLRQKAKIALGQSDSLCAIRCGQYVLDMFNIHKPLTELKHLAEEKGWLEDNGVNIKNIGSIPKYYGLKTTSRKCNIDSLSFALHEGKQVLVAVDGGELIGNPFEEKLEDVLVGGIADHCVVVLNYDEAEKKVMLFDPAFGEIPLTVSLETFLDAWEDSGYYSIEISNQKKN